MNSADHGTYIACSIPRLHPSVQQVPMLEGTINLRGPVLRRSVWSRWVAWLLRLPSRVEVALDEIGTFVVRNIDGQKSMEELGDLLAQTYKLTRREAQAALTTFVKALLQRRLLILDGLLGNAA